MGLRGQQLVHMWVFFDLHVLFCFLRKALSQHLKIRFCINPHSWLLLTKKKKSDLSTLALNERPHATPSWKVHGARSGDLCSPGSRGRVHLPLAG